MKKLESLFEIKNLQQAEGAFSAAIILNSHHVVFKGHFPGYPLTPAVVQLYFINAILDRIYKNTFYLVSSPKAYFLKVINPNEIQEIDIIGEVKEEKEHVFINAKGMSRNELLFKFSGYFKVLSESQ